MTVPREKIRAGLNYSGHQSPCPLIRLCRRGGQAGWGWLQGTQCQTSLQCLCPGTWFLCCLHRCGGCREENYEVCQNMTWMKSRRLLCSIFPFLLFVHLFFPFFHACHLFLIHLLFVSSFGIQMGCLGEEVSFKVWWLKTQGQSWWAERPDANVTQAGGSWAHSLAEGQGSWEVTVKGFFCRVLLAAALAVPCPGVTLSTWYPPSQAFFCLSLQRYLSSAPWGRPRGLRGGRVQLLWTLCLVLTFLLENRRAFDVQSRYVLASATCSQICTSQLFRGLSSTTVFCRAFPASHLSHPATCNLLFVPYNSLLDHGCTACYSSYRWRCSWGV